jgi:hypothetical protein
MGFSWIPREAPLLGPQPAVPFRHFEAAAEPSDFLPASLREPLGEGRFRQRVACALAREDRDRRNPPREIHLTGARCGTPPRVARSELGDRGA